MRRLSITAFALSSILFSSDYTQQIPDASSDECGRYKMRVVKPSEDIDYKLIVVRPAEGVDFKGRVINPCASDKSPLALVPRSIPNQDWKIPRSTPDQNDINIFITPSFKSQLKPETTQNVPSEVLKKYQLPSDQNSRKN